MNSHDQQLAFLVRPSTWTNPTPDGRYNLVVIGGGTAGLVTAAGAAGLGAKVALIERASLGGDCLNFGCVPSKAILRSARVAAELREASELGWTVSSGAPIGTSLGTSLGSPAGASIEKSAGVSPGPQPDFAAVMERMRSLRASLAKHDSAERFRDLGVDVYLGAARFASPTSVEVAGQTLEFSRACIATGGRPAVPPISGLVATGYLTNETVFSLDSRPARLAVIGAGPIGCELAQAMARLGCQVTLLARGERVLPRDDPDASGLVRAALEQDGVDVRIGTRVLESRGSNSSPAASLNIEGPDHRATWLTVDAVLVAAGRQANVNGLNLESAGIQYDPKGGVRVDDRLRTTNRRVFAAGDVCSTYRFTHAADAMARIVVQNALFWPTARVSRLTIPWCTYTDPEVAHVGWSPERLREAGDRVRTIFVPFEQVDRAVLDGNVRGFLRVHLAGNSDRMLAATLVGRHAGDMISELTLAIQAKWGLRKLARVIHPYPTYSDVVRKAADQYNRGRLTPTVRYWFDRWLKWNR